MRVLGIIAEYNPFHNGHRYHLEQSMALTGADCSIAVMSGNFLQRGEPAMWDKRIRAEMAVKNGVDLVVELPFVFACNNAEQFAYGGISLLNGLGCITDFAFGCEGELHSLMEAARLLADETEEYKAALSEALNRGLSYPSARTQALAACGAEQAAELLTQPNNILAAEYLKQCILTGSAMKPWGIHRLDGGYNSEELPDKEVLNKEPAMRPTASARAIRTALRRAGMSESGGIGQGKYQKTDQDKEIDKEIEQAKDRDQDKEIDLLKIRRIGLDCVKDFLPVETVEVLLKVERDGYTGGRNGRAEALETGDGIGGERNSCGASFDIEALFPLVAARLRTAAARELSQIYAVSEGMENLMKKAVLTAKDMESLLSKMKTKRYTRTRLQRALVQALVGLTAEDYSQIVSQRIHYAHVLAFSSRGAKLLSHIKKDGCAQIPVYSNLSREADSAAKEQQSLKYDLLAADLYHIAAGKQIYGSSDLVLSPFYQR